MDVPLWSTGGERCPEVVDALVSFSVDNAAGHSSDVVLRRRDGVLVLEVHDVRVLHEMADDPCWHRRAAAFHQAGEVVRVEHDGLHLLTMGAVKTGPPFLALGGWSGAASVTGAGVERLVRHQGLEPRTR